SLYPFGKLNNATCPSPYIMFQPRLPRLLCQTLLACADALILPSPASREPIQGQSPCRILVDGLSAISLLFIGVASGEPFVANESPVTCLTPNQSTAHITR